MFLKEYPFTPFTMNKPRKIWKTGNTAVITLGKKFLRENNLKLGDLIRLDRVVKVRIVVKDVKEGDIKPNRFINTL